MQDGPVQITKRHLPHWTVTGATYFVTFRARSKSLSLDEQKLVLDQVRGGHGRYYDLFAAVIMPTHVHLLLTPRTEYSLSRIMKGLKGAAAHRINQLRHSRGQVWQQESYDRIVRDQNELNEKMNYMLNNPLKEGLSDDPWDYHGWYCNLEDR